MSNQAGEREGVAVQRTYKFIPNRRRRILRRLFVFVVGSVVAVGVFWWLVGPMVTSIEERKFQAAAAAQAEREYTPPKLAGGPRTPALSFEGFDPGNLISDEEFFDADAMDEAAIEEFIETWNRGCRTGVEETPCLSEYVEDSRSYPADNYCPGGFEGRYGDTPAAIIARVAQSCGVNPQVILTTLQKEQGLITTSGMELNPTRYAIAMGFACPDETMCDSHYFGLANQIYHGVRQLKVYTVHSRDFGTKAGQVNAIRYSPEVACGSSEVFVENQATANLYNYTPYQPNEEALAGKQGPCVAVGNLNFYGYFNAWFGPEAPEWDKADEDDPEPKEAG